MIDKFNGEQKEALLNNLWSYAGQTLNKTDDELASLFLNEDETLNNEGLNVLLGIHSEHIQGIKSQGAGKFDDGYSKGKKETLTREEKKFRDKYGIDSDGSLEEMFSEVLESKVNEVRGQLEGKEITEEDFKKSDLYARMLDEKKALNQEWETKYQTREKEWQAQALKAQVAKIAVAEVEKLKPVLDADAQRASNQKQFLLDQIAALNWTIVDGQLKPLNDAGEHLTNAQGHGIDAAEVIKGVVTRYHSLSVADPHNPVNPANPKAPKGMPATAEEYFEALSKVKPEDKAALKQYGREKGFV